MGFETPTCLTGVNYIPQVGMIEDFSPKWILDRWTKERMEEDFRIISSLGLSIVRFHISPGDPDTIVFPGLKPGKYLEMLDAAVEFQEVYGLSILLDIGAFYEELTEEAIRLYVGRYKGRITYYQLGNEIYEQTSDPDKFKNVVRLMRLAKSIDPNAKFSSDIKAVDLHRYSKELPEDVAEFDFHPIHFYCPVDHTGWDEASLEVFQRFCTTDEEVEYPEGYHVIPWCRGKGFGGLQQERWVTEACGQGYFRWGNVTDEEVMAEGWRKALKSLKTKDGPAVVLHHCFRDKMSWREFGIGQSGIVALDGSLKKVAEVFREESLPMLPDSDLRKHVEVVIITSSTSEFSVKILNNSSQRINGDLSMVFHQQKTSSLKVNLEAGSSVTMNIDISSLKLEKGRNNVFACLSTQGKTIWSTCSVTQPQTISLESSNPFDGVVYPDGFKAIEDFINLNGKGLPLITGPLTGKECEMGYRLKCVLDHLLGGKSKMSGSMDCLEATRRPFAVVGTEEFNPLIQLMLLNMPEDRHPSSLYSEGCQGFVQIVPLPFGGNRNGLTQRSLGIRQPKDVPSALYIGGVDLEGLKLATYDLIRRMWPHSIGEDMITFEARDMLDLEAPIPRHT